MTFLADESSVESSQPRELITISINEGVTVYRHTSATRDMFHEGAVYKAIPIERGEQVIAMPGNEQDMTLSLPANHPLVTRWTQQSQPPRKVTVTVQRKQMRSGEVRQIWVGDIKAMSIEGLIAKFRIPSRVGEWMLRSVPSALVSAACPHMLYDSMCKVSRTGSAPSGIPHKQTTTVILIDGTDIVVNLPDVTPSDPYRADWAALGEVVHPATGERATVRVQTDPAPGTGTTARLTLSNPLVGLMVGHTVEVYAGCDWAIEMCHNKFDNRQHYGGFPQLPSSNPFVPSGTGSRGA